MSQYILDFLSAKAEKRSISPASVRSEPIARSRSSSRGSSAESRSLLDRKPEVPKDKSRGQGSPAGSRTSSGDRSSFLKRFKVKAPELVESKLAAPVNHAEGKEASSTAASKTNLKVKKRANVKGSTDSNVVSHSLISPIKPEVSEDSSTSDTILPPPSAEKTAAKVKSVVKQFPKPRGRRKKSIEGESLDKTKVDTAQVEVKPEVSEEANKTSSESLDVSTVESKEVSKETSDLNKEPTEKPSDLPEEKTGDNTTPNEMSSKISGSSIKPMQLVTIRKKVKISTKTIRRKKKSNLKKTYQESPNIREGEQVVATVAQVHAVPAESRLSDPGTSTVEPDKENTTSKCDPGTSAVEPERQLTDGNKSDPGTVAVEPEGEHTDANKCDTSQPDLTLSEKVEDMSTPVVVPFTHPKKRKCTWAKGGLPKAKRKKSEPVEGSGPRRGRKKKTKVSVENPSTEVVTDLVDSSDTSKSTDNSGMYIHPSIKAVITSTLADDETPSDVKSTSPTVKDVNEEAEEAGPQQTPDSDDKSAQDDEKKTEEIKPKEADEVMEETSESSSKDEVKLSTNSPEETKVAESSEKASDKEDDEPKAHSSQQSLPAGSEEESTADKIDTVDKPDEDVTDTSKCGPSDKDTVTDPDAVTPDEPNDGDILSSTKCINNNSEAKLICDDSEGTADVSSSKTGVENDEIPDTDMGVTTTEEEQDGKCPSSSEPETASVVNYDDATSPQGETEIADKGITSLTEEICDEDNFTLALEIEEESPRKYPIQDKQDVESSEPLTLSEACKESLAQLKTLAESTEASLADPSVDVSEHSSTSDKLEISEAQNEDAKGDETEKNADPCHDSSITSSVSAPVIEGSSCANIVSNSEDAPVTEAGTESDSVEDTVGQVMSDLVEQVVQSMPLVERTSPVLSQPACDEDIDFTKAIQETIQFVSDEVVSLCDTECVLSSSPQRSGLTSIPAKEALNVSPLNPPGVSSGEYVDMETAYKLATTVVEVPPTPPKQSVKQGMNSVKTSEEICTATDLPDVGEASSPVKPVSQDTEMERSEADKIQQMIAMGEDASTHPRITRESSRARSFSREATPFSREHTPDSVISIESTSTGGRKKRRRGELDLLHETETLQHKRLRMIRHAKKTHQQQTLAMLQQAEGQLVASLSSSAASTPTQDNTPLSELALEGLVEAEKDRKVEAALVASVVSPSLPKESLDSDNKSSPQEGRVSEHVMAPLLSDLSSLDSPLIRDDNDSEISGMTDLSQSTESAESRTPRIPSPSKMKTRGKRNRFWHKYAKQPRKQTDKPERPKKETMAEKLARAKRESLLELQRERQLRLLEQCQPCSVVVVDFIKCLDINNLQKSPRRSAHTSPARDSSGVSPVSFQSITVGQAKHKISPVSKSASPSPKKSRLIQRSEFEGAFLNFLKKPDSPAKQNTKKGTKKSATPEKTAAASEPSEATAEATVVTGNEANKPKDTTEAESGVEQPVTKKSSLISNLTDASREEAFLRAEQAVSPTVKKRDRYQCLSCTYSTSARHTIEEHIYNHLSIVPFSCGHCSAIYGTRSGVTVHSRKEHPGLEYNIIKKTEIDEKKYYIDRDRPINIEPPMAEFKITSNTATRVLTKGKTARKGKKKNAISNQETCKSQLKLTLQRSSPTPAKEATWIATTNTALPTPSQTVGRKNYSPSVAKTNSSTKTTSATKTTKNLTAKQAAKSAANAAKAISSKTTSTATKTKNASAAKNAGPKGQAAKAAGKSAAAKSVIVSPQISRIHGINVDPQVPYYQCRYCTFASQIESMAKGHVDQHHQSERTYVCPLCELAFCKHEEAMRRHFRKWHPKDPVYLLLQPGYYDVNKQRGEAVPPTLVSDPMCEEDKTSPAKTLKEPPTPQRHILNVPSLPFNNTSPTRPDTGRSPQHERSAGDTTHGSPAETVSRVQEAVAFVNNVMQHPGERLPDITANGQATNKEPQVRQAEDRCQPLLC